MEVLLINPPRLTGLDTPHELPNQTVMPSYGLAYLASYLKSHGIGVRQADLWIQVHHDNRFCPRRKHVDLALFEDEQRVGRFLAGKADGGLQRNGELLLKKLGSKGFDVYGLSLSDHEKDFSLMGTTLVLAKLLGERTGARIVAGGHCPEVLGYQGRHSPFDHVVFGEGHAGLVEYCRKEFPREVGVPDVQRRGKAVRGNFRLTTEGFQMPDFEGLGLELYAKPYFNAKFKHDAVLPYKFVRGCLFNCVFCADSLDPSCEALPPGQVVQELSKLCRRYGVRNFMFLNSNFNPTKEYAMELASAIAEAGLNIRFSESLNLKLTHRPLLSKMLDAGATRLLFGIETGSRRMLSYIRKGVSLDYAERRLKLINELGIWSGLEMIAGLPHETEQDIRETLWFIERVKGNVCYIHLSQFRLLPHSQLSGFPARYGLRSVRMNEDPATKQAYQWRYDEVNGLTWEMKVAQIEDSYRRIRAVIEEHNRRTNINLNTLFPLYDKYGTRDKVMEVLDSFSETG